MNLKKSTDRMLFLAGMVVTFIGLLIPFIRIEDEGLKNVFAAASFFNVGGTAFISTFVVVIWLASIAGIILYFVTNSIVGDFIVWLIAAGFGIAATVTLAVYTVENSVADNPSAFGYISFGSVIIFIGMTASLVALVLEAKHIQHPLDKKAD